MRMAEHQGALEAERAHGRAERERLVEQLAEGERQRQWQVGELARAHDQVTRLEAEAVEQEHALAASHAENARLNAQVDAAEHTARSLASDLEQRGRQLLEKERQLQARDHLLQRITSSLGWRVLNRYRALKHPVVLPLRRMAAVWEVLAPREYRPVLQPGQDLQWLDELGVWESTDRDPQFNVAGPWPRGWTEVVLDIAPESGLAGRARLYVDRGPGYSESDSYELGEGGGSRTRFVKLGPEVIELRLDPCESAGRFRVRTFSLKRVAARLARRANESREVPRPGPASPLEFPPATGLAGGETVIVHGTENLTDGSRVKVKTGNEK